EPGPESAVSGAEGMGHRLAEVLLQPLVERLDQRRIRLRIEGLDRVGRVTHRLAHERLMVVRRFRHLGERSRQTAHGARIESHPSWIRCSRASGSGSELYVSTTRPISAIMRNRFGRLIAFARRPFSIRSMIFEITST